MKNAIKRISLLLAVLLTCSLSHAADRDGILVYAEGVETSYLLTQNPRIHYVTENNVKVARIFVDNITEPVVEVQLVGDKTLKIVFTSTTDIHTMRDNKPLHKNGKLIKYGKVIVIKDGKEYDLNGKRIK